MPFKETPGSVGLRFYPTRYYTEILDIEPVVHVVNYNDIIFNENIIKILKNSEWDYVLINDTDQPSVEADTVLQRFYQHFDRSKIFRITGDARYILAPEENTLFYPYYQYCFLEGNLHPSHLPIWPKIWEIDSNVLISNRNYLASCLNNLCRYHRFLLLDKLVDKSYFNKILYSFNGNIINEPYIPDFDKVRYERILEKTKHLLPLTIDKREPGSPHLFPKGIHDMMLTNDHISTRDSYLNIITENTYVCSFLSEKIWKPISTGQFFVTLSGVNTIEALRRLGYDVFDDYIDHSYDTEPDLYKRVDKLIDSIDQFMNLDHKLIWKETYARRLNNAKKFFDVDINYNPIKELFKNII